MRLVILIMMLMMGGCQLAPSVVAAGLGFGAAALNLDTELAKDYVSWRETAQPVAATP